jgi:hypothetical protein
MCSNMIQVKRRASARQASTLAGALRAKGGWVVQRRWDLAANRSHRRERQCQIVKSRLERMPADQFEDQVGGIEIATATG